MSDKGGGIGSEHVKNEGADRSRSTNWKGDRTRPDPEEDTDPTRSGVPDPNRMERGQGRRTKPNRILGLLLHDNSFEDPLQFDQNPRCKGSPNEKLELKIQMGINEFASWLGFAAGRVPRSYRRL